MKPNRHITKLQLLHCLARLVEQTDLKGLDCSIQWHAHESRQKRCYAKVSVSQREGELSEAVVFRFPMLTQEAEAKITQLLTTVNGKLAQTAQKQ